MDVIKYDNLLGIGLQNEDDSGYTYIVPLKSGLDEEMLKKMAFAELMYEVLRTFETARTKADIAWANERMLKILKNIELSTPKQINPR